MTTQNPPTTRATRAPNGKAQKYPLHSVATPLAGKSRSNRRMRQFLLAAVTGGALIAVPQAPKAFAQSLTGSWTTTQSITAATVVATADGSFNVNTTVTPPYGNALEITSTGATTYSDAAGTVLNAGAGGVGLNINSAGAVTVTTLGDISGALGGINAINSGIAATAITVSGTVTSANGTAINASKTIGGGGALTITANNGSIINGAASGISAYNAGVADTTINSYGTTVHGGTGAGIYATKTNAVAVI